jgi:hypothetical protein
MKFTILAKLDCFAGYLVILLLVIVAGSSADHFLFNRAILANKKAKIL